MDGSCAPLARCQRVRLIAAALRTFVEVLAIRFSAEGSPAGRTPDPSVKSSGRIFRCLSIEETCVRRVRVLSVFRGVRVD
jgi:hypothetical protein